MKMRFFKKQIMVFALFMLAVFAFPKAVSANDTIPVNGMNGEPLLWGQAYKGVTKIGADWYKYTFTLSQSGRVSIMMSEPKYDVGYAVYDSAGNRLVRREYGNPGNYAYSFDLVAGDYYIAVYDSYEYDWNDADFSMSAQFAPSGETVQEHQLQSNNMATMASPYALNQSVIGQFAVNDDMDVYTFNVAKTGYITINVNTSEIKDIDYSLTDSANSVNYSRRDINQSGSKDKYFCPAGTYYLTFFRQGDEVGYTGTYIFSATRGNIPATKVTKLKAKKVKNYYKKYYRYLTVNWTAKGDITGYEIQIAKKKNFKKGKQSFIQNGTEYKTYTINLNKKGTYYARVRTFIEDGHNKRYYSSWSNVKSIKVK